MRFSSPVRFVFSAVLPLFLVLAACDSGGGNEEEINNQFQLEISEVGETETANATVAAKDQKELTGFSFFAEGTDPETGESGFGLYLSDDESFGEDSAQQGLFGLAVRQGGRPSTGSHAITASEDGIDLGNSMGMILFEDVGEIQNGASYYIGTGGSIDFETSNDRRVSGTFDVEAMHVQFQFDNSTGEVSGDTTDVVITGQFTAKNADTFLPPGVAPNAGSSQ